jgi:hypothetical protein
LANRHADHGDHHDANAKSEKIQRILDEIPRFLAVLKTTAEQLTPGEGWRRILSRAFSKLLGEKPLGAPEILPLWSG